MDFRRVNQKTMSQIIGVSSRTIRNWDECPRNDDGTYDTAAVIEYLVNESTTQTTTGEDTESAGWLNLLRKERALIAQIERRKLEESVLLRKDVIDRAVQQARAVQAGLDALAQRLGPLIVGKTITEVIETTRKETTKIMEDWSQKGQFVIEEMEDDDAGITQEE